MKIKNTTTQNPLSSNVVERLCFVLFCFERGSLCVVLAIFEVTHYLDQAVLSQTQGVPSASSVLGFKVLHYHAQPKLLFFKCKVIYMTH